MKCLALILAFITLSLPTWAQVIDSEEETPMEFYELGTEHSSQQEQELLNPSLDVPSLNEYGNPDAPLDDEFESDYLMNENIEE